MPKLEDDSFFSERVALAIRACLDSRENLNIISPIELKIMRQAPLVRKLNRELDEQLLERLREWSTAIVANDALAILLDATREGVISLVTELLDTAVSLEITIDLEGAYSTLEKAQEEGLPPSWILQILGDELREGSDETESRPFRIAPL